MFCVCGWGGGGGRGECHDYIKKNNMAPKQDHTRRGVGIILYDMDGFCNHNKRLNVTLWRENKWEQLIYMPRIKIN